MNQDVMVAGSTHRATAWRQTRMSTPGHREELRMIRDNRTYPLRE